jgi:hypothetical protein
VSLSAFGVGGAASLSFFELVAEGKAVFTLSRAWTTTSLLDEGKINRALIKGNGSGDKSCDSTNVGVGVPVQLTGLAMRVEGLFNGGRQ